MCKVGLKMCNSLVLIAPAVETAHGCCAEAKPRLTRAAAGALSLDHRLHSLAGAVHMYASTILVSDEGLLNFDDSLQAV